jgi:hypothetical protein
MLKVFLKVCINVSLVFLIVFSLAVSATFAGNSKNYFLFYLFVALIVLYNTKSKGWLTAKRRIVIIILIVVLCFGYLAIPKENKACQAPVGGIGCTSHYCVGLPLTDFHPTCVGYSFGEVSTFTPDK